jgi:3-oxoacyl-[acyl-carrier-protein] synthase III
VIAGERRYARMVACAGYAPEGILTNATLAERVDTTDEWIAARTGIRERRIARSDQATSDLAIQAARRVLDQAGVDPGELDVVIVGTCTPDHLFPSTASLVCEQLGIRAGSFDLVNACSSWVYGLAQGCGLIEAGIAKNVLVLGAETLSRITDWSDRSTCVLFGDGAGGALLTSSPTPDGYGFMAFDLGTEPDQASLVLGAGGSRQPANQAHATGPEGYIAMNGRAVFKWASRMIVESTERLLAQAGLTPDDVDLFVPHQANLRIIEHALERTGIPPDRVVVNIDRFGNTSAASVPLALGEAFEQGRVNDGDVVLAIGFGAGLAHAGTILRYGGGHE